MLHHFFLPLNSSEERTDASNQSVAFFVIDKLRHHVSDFQLHPLGQQNDHAKGSKILSLPCYPPFF